MPIIKSAKKKLRQDVKRTKRNLKYEISYKNAIDAVKKHKTKSLLQKAYKAIDKAVKKRVIHRNKGNRLKAMVARLSKK